MMRRTRTLQAPLAILLTTSLLCSQDLDALRQNIRSGDTVIVTKDDRTTINGQLLGVSGEQISIKVRGVPESVSTTQLMRDYYCPPGDTVIAATLGAGIGAAVGAAIDLSIRRFDTIFPLTTTSSSVGVRVVPLVTRNKRGAQITFSFE